MKFNVFFCCLCLVLLSMQTSVCQGQKKYHFKAESNTLASTTKPLPFWLRSNQYGMYQDTAKFHQVLYFKLDKSFNKNDKVSTAWGISTWGQSADRTEVHLEEIYFQLKWQKLVLSMGKQRESIQMNGISSTNGNILFSQNTRPIPSVKLELCDYLIIPFTNKFLQFKGYWRDGILTDKRYVDNTLVHNKKLMLKWGRSQAFYVETGLEHVAQWAGDSYSRGNLPHSFRDYLSVISGQEGAQVETINALGNHIGAYHLMFNFTRENQSFQLFMQHPFEDRSGREFDNWPDGLYGFYWERKEKSKLINHFIYEFYYTKNQSGPLHNNEFGHILSGNDNYFSNGTYPDGWTYFGQTIGSPFFKAQRRDFLVNSGLNSAMENSRFVTHHIGFAGVFQTLEYKTLVSYSRNFGTFNFEFDKRKDQFSFFTELKWQTKKKTLEISGALAFDKGDLYPSGLGGRLRIIKNFNF